MTSVDAQAVDDVVDDSVGVAAVLAAVPGLSYRRLDFWTRRGWLVPVVRDEDAGSGFPRRYTLAEVAVASRMWALVEVGFETSVAAGAARDGRATVPLSDRVSVQIDDAADQPLPTAWVDVSYVEQSP
jgi:hypothetical protein